MKNYLKCAWANVFTRYGYIFAFPGLICMYTVPERLYWYAFMMYHMGCAALAGSALGAVTLLEYQRVTAMCKKYGRAPEFTSDKLRSMTYCNRVGVIVALRDFERKGSG